MEILADLNRALSLLGSDKDGDYATGWLYEYDGLMWLTAASKGQKPTDQAKSIESNLNDLFVLMHRLSWQKSERAKGKIPAIMWMRYADLDIDLFHVKLRSTFDHLAAVIAKNSARPGEVPSRSFNKLTEFAIKSNNDAKLGKSLADVVGSCTWFGNIKSVRDSIVHHDELTLAYPDSGTILVQVYDHRSAIEPFLLHSPNIIDFELYSALYVGRTLSLLDHTCETIFSHKGLKSTGTFPRRYNSGVTVAKAWIERLVHKLTP